MAKKQPNTPSPNDTATHKQKLLTHLMAGKRITGLTALNLYQCFSLSQRLGELRRVHEIPIQSEFITLPNGKKIKEYWLSPDYIQQHKKVTA